MSGIVGGIQNRNSVVGEAYATTDNGGIFTLKNDTAAAMTKPNWTTDALLLDSTNLGHPAHTTSGPFVGTPSTKVTLTRGELGEESTWNPMCYQIAGHYNYHRVPVASVADAQNQVNDFGKWKEQLTQQALQQYNQQQEQQQLNDIDQFAQQYGINYDREDFLKAAKAKNLEPQNWGDYFKAQAVDVAMKSAANRAAESALTNKSSIPGTLPNSSKSSGSDSGLSTRQLLERALG